ncbi:MAG: YitT family protein [Clostridia bacterium]|nr:YitT family protein [Clostridia bacterium]
MRKYKEIILRYLVFLFGLAVMALAIAVMSCAQLGISPIQSTCYVIYHRISDYISLGTMVFLWNCLIVLAQLPIKGKRFGWINWLQIPLSVFLGAMVDVFRSLLFWLTPENMVQKIVAMLCGVILLAIAISITVAAKTVMNAGEALVAAIAEKCGRPFGKVKVIFDVSLISFAILLSFVFFGKWRFDIIGLGTLVAATTTGHIVNLTGKWIIPAVNRICSGKKDV